MLNVMRKLAGGFAAKILLGLLILSFGVWGVEDMLRNHGSSGPLATVGGHEIPRNVFAHEYRQQVNRAREMLGKNYTPEVLKMLRLEQQVMDQLITNELMRLETASLGILPGDEAVISELRSNPAFKNDKGAFDKGRFEALLRQNGMNEQSFIEALKRQKANEMLLSTLAAVAPVNDVMIATQAEAQAEERSAYVAMLSPSLIKDVKAPDDAAVEAFYKQHLDAFNVPESRVFSYVTVKRDELLKSVTVTPEQVKQAYKERAAMFGKDAAPLEQVKGDIEKELKNEHAEEAVTQFSTKLEDLLAGGSSLAEAAKELKLSYATFGPVERDGTAPDGSKMNPPFENFLPVAYRIDEGADSPLTPGNKEGVYFLAHVEKVNPEQAEPLAKVRSKVIAGWQHQEQMTKLRALAEETAKEAKDSKDPESVFAKHGINVTPSGMIRRNSPKTSTNLQLPAGLIAELFAASTGKSTDAYPAGQDTYMIAVAKERKAPAKVTAAMLASDVQIKQLREQMSKDAKRDVMDGYLGYLRSKYSVSINDEALAEMTSGDQ